MRTEDLYNAKQHYLDPSYSSTALSGQASCIIVLLFFVPELLHNDNIGMEEIVKRFLHDCFVVPLFMGFLLDLQLSWEGFRAAKNSLGPIIALPHVRNLTAKYGGQVPELSEELSCLLAEGVLTSDFVIRHVTELLRTIRQSNVLLRWVFLHRCSSNRKVREVMNTAIPGGENDAIFQLLLDTSRLEFNVRKHYQEVLDSKKNVGRILKKRQKIVSPNFPIFLPAHKFC